MMNISQPDQAFLIVSSRNESAFNIPSFDPASNATIVSDTLINFSIDPATGALTTLQEVPSGGRFPRHFSFNADTTLLATTQQQDGRVVIIERDPETGLLGDFVTTADVEGEVTNVVFHES
jgi:6-phosphogluconolactonase (cycloisomerase 2 family)